MLDIRDVPAVVINIPEAADRRRAIETHFGALGIDFSFVPGATGQNKIQNCARAHLNAFEAVDGVPFMVFEDDVELQWTTTVLPDPPPGADVIYLGTNTAGCFPNTARNKELFGHRSLDGFALATACDVSYLRLHSMVSAHAILFLTERARRAYYDQLVIAHRRKTPLDVRYAYLMPDYNVYAVRTPMFVESQALQPKGKTSEERRHITNSPLPVAEEGDTRTANKRGKSIVARVCADGRGGYEWQVVALTPPLD